ncbi:hypothetical protein HC928_19225 [bacterium]|nr:hypothetical protein [bacterium]
MFKVVVGHSNDLDSDDAIAEVLTQCDRSLPGVTPKAGILLAAIDFDHASILHKIHDTFPGIQLIGGTTDGEISSVLGFEQDSITLMLFCSDGIDIQAGIGRNVSQNLHASVREAVERATLRNQQEIKFCITLPESWTVSALSILEALKQVLGKEIPIFGGLTAGQSQIQRTYQFFQSEVYSDAVPILLFSGSVLFSHGIASGWHPIGKQGQITKVRENIVYEIDGKPALDFYRHYLGDLPPSGEYPLAVFDVLSQHYYMRAPSGIYDPVIGSINFFGDVPEGAIVQLTETTRNDILAASQISMQRALESYPGESPDAALFFSCVSRRQILGSRTKEEYELVKSCLSEVLPACGFYTNGEIAPLYRQGVTHFHNETFITLLMGEK